MARKGRKRKEGKRTRTGKLSEANAARAARGLKGAMDVALAQPHRAWLGKGRRTDQLAENALGRLKLAGKITDAEYWAGDRWRNLIGEFHQVLASPVMPSSALGRMVAEEVNEDSRRRLEESGTAERQESDEERLDRVLAQHGCAMSALRKLDDARAVFTAMERIVLADGEADESSLKALKAGLLQLAHLWRMQEREDPIEEKHGRKPKVRAVRTDKALWGHEEKELSIRYK